jgi:electron-transferring-flavoprotein dehydrogenase
VGFVVHLDYKNPYLSPYEEFQRFKHHPLIAELLEGGERLSYGARAISEGGYQSVPRLVAPGALLVGCAAGFVNVPRIKGTHNALQSGLLAAEHLAQALKKGRANDTLETYEDAWRESPVGQDLYPVRNVKPLWSRFGTGLGMLLAGAELWCQHLFKASPWGTLQHQRADHQGLTPVSEAKPIEYPKPDGILSFDRLSSVQLTNVWHEEDQPVHLHLRDAHIPIAVNLPTYAEPAQRYCPAGVYEVVATATGPQFVINAQNCIHCKTCDIKDPSQNITWVTPEGGQGPSYAAM